MNMHKSIRLTPHDRKEVWGLWQTGAWKKVKLSERFRVSRPTIDKILNRTRKQEFSPRNSSNHRFNSIKFGIKRLAKVEGALERKRKAEARRYKAYLGEMIHFDTKRLPLLKGEDNTMPREHLFVAIDDYSRELYATILPDKSQYSAATFLQQVLDECPYTVECAYSDNGTEYKGTDTHAFVALCRTASIGQKFTRVKRPQTNGKAERVIRTLMEMWHTQHQFKDSKQRKASLLRFLNGYNTVKPHKGIDGMTPYEKLYQYFYDQECKQRWGFLHFSRF